jgi:hypothetical protein
MKYFPLLVLALMAIGCGKKEQESEVVPPGFCKTQEECQPTADRQNQAQKTLREKLRAQGVHEQYLPCGPYEASKAPNGFWQVTRNTTGCPANASQQDPHPDLSKAKHTKP